jgi:hypothetical protein
VGEGAEVEELLKEAVRTKIYGDKGHVSLSDFRAKVRWTDQYAGTLGNVTTWVTSFVQDRKPQLGLEVTAGAGGTAKVLFRTDFLEVILCLMASSQEYFGDRLTKTIAEIARRIAEDISHLERTHIIVRYLSAITDLCPYTGLTIEGTNITYDPEVAAEHALFFPQYGAVDTIFARRNGAPFLFVELGQPYSGLHWRVRYFDRLGTMTPWLKDIVAGYPKYRYSSVGCIGQLSLAPAAGADNIEYTGKLVSSLFRSNWLLAPLPALHTPSPAHHPKFPTFIILRFIDEIRVTFSS